MPLRIKPLAGLVTVLATLLVLPALAAAPQHVLTTIRGLNERLLETAVRPTFFWGEVTLEPGWGFYPVTVLMRLSPVVMVGIILAVVRWLAVLVQLPGSRFAGSRQVHGSGSNRYRHRARVCRALWARIRAARIPRVRAGYALLPVGRSQNRVWRGLSSIRADPLWRSRWHCVRV